MIHSNEQHRRADSKCTVKKAALQLEVSALADRESSVFVVCHRCQEEVPLAVHSSLDMLPLRSSHEGWSQSNLPPVRHERGEHSVRASCVTSSERTLSPAEGIMVQPLLCPLREKG